MCSQGGSVMSKEKVRSLYNGVDIPIIGYGTFKIDNDTARKSVCAALEKGYRHIDTASFYGNEKGVGLGIRDSGIPREEIFLTSKVWNNEQGFSPAQAAFEATLKRLDTEYLDLYLVHWPKELTLETWSAMEILYGEGKARSIGVSNFKIHHLQEVLDHGDIVPMVNQVELHPQYPQKRLRKFCEKFDIVVESWAPLMRGKIFSIPLFQELSEKYRKTIPQIVLRWHYQMGLVSLAKTTSPERMEENRDIFDFELSSDDMKLFESVKGDRIGPDPDSITF